MGDDDKSAEQEPVYLLYDYTDLVGVYADREAAEADRAVLVAQARADWEAEQWRVTAVFVEPRIEVVEVVPLRRPKLTAKSA